MKDMWNQRYAEKEYAYGEEPNEFFRKSLLHLKADPGRILMPADGEGRNGVYAAILGWDVLSFDYSFEARNKALELAGKNGVEIQFEVGSFEEIKENLESVDAVGLIFAHFSPEIRANYHNGFQDLLRPGGYIVLEGFSKGHLDYQSRYPNVGGPKAAALLFSEEMIRRDFSKCEIIHLETCETRLDEGKFHQGRGQVVRFIGRKK